MKLVNKIYFLILSACLSGLFLSPYSYGQPVPGKDENITALVTFGKQGETSWGDDDFNSVWFFAIPRDFTQQFYIRVFDPDTGGEHDEIQGEFNTRTTFSIYGGQGVDPDKNEESKGWTSGDDGNLYRYFLSRDPENNIPIEGANAFTYEYTFRMWNDFKSVAHVYPYVDTGVIYIRLRNFDWDRDGHILVVSTYKQGIDAPISNEDDWADYRIAIEPKEVGSSLDFQFHKRQGELVKNNNVVVTLENQRGDALQFFSSPIGGVPVYQTSIQYRKVKPK